MNCSLQNAIRSIWTMLLVLGISLSTALAAPFSLIDVKGTVSDADNTPLVGASVRVKGTTIGALTDAEGKFSINAPDGNGTLIVSYVGYQTQEVAINNRSQVNIVMAVDETTLEEIVVTGYGSQAKRDVTAAISSVSADEIATIPVGNPLKALQGRAPGVDIQETGGRPGQNPSILIRGRRSINASNQPLFVIDGVPVVENSTFFNINPQDIQSMEILKDAAATSIYGSRGANGVIIVTTKRGSDGKPVVGYDGYYGISSVTRQVDMMNGEEWADLKRESRRIETINGRAVSSYKGIIPPDEQIFLDAVELESIKLGRYTDYQDLILNEGHQQNHQLSVRGGNANTAYLISSGFFEEQGIISTMDFTRYNLRVNVDQRIGKMLKIGTSTTLSRSIQNFASNPMGEALQNNPLGVPYDADGNLIFLPVTDGLRTNPLNEVVDGAYIDERKDHNILSSIYGEFTPFKGFQYKVLFGPELRFFRRGLFQDKLTNARRGADPVAAKEDLQSFSYTLENLINYNTTVADKHNLKFTALQSIQEFDFENTYLEVLNLPYSSQTFNNLETAESVRSFSSGFSEWQLASFMGRINYDFNNKYLLQISGRADGSSRLAEGNKWAFFPGVSAGWRITDENFMKNIKVVNDLKLRASYGQVGNTSINPYQTQGALARSTYVFGSTAAFGYGLGAIPNPSLTWEKTATFDVGVDFGLFNGRLSGSLDVYRANTTDLLLARQLPFTSGYTSVLENVGETQNTGVEVLLETVNFDTPGGFRWTTSLNWFANKEEIIELYGGQQDDIGNRWFIGEALNVFFDYQKIGIWQLGEEDAATKFDKSIPGDIKLADLNGNGVFDPGDRKILGTDVPDFSGGITNNFEYKGFDLSFFFFARMGHMIFSSFHNDGGLNGLFGRYNNLDVDYWTPTNPTNSNPRPNQNQEFPKYSGTRAYFDGSYVKLRNVTFGYTFPSALANKAKLQSLRIYGSAQNPWFWSEYDTYDPEVGIQGNSFRPENVDGDVPSAKLFLVGLNLSF